MNAGELCETFRSEIDDTAEPYLWSEADAWRYANAAYRQFVRLTGGIGDFTSVATVIKVRAGNPVVDLHPSILKIRRATLVSTRRQIRIISPEKEGTQSRDDYGTSLPIYTDDTPGEVSVLVLGGAPHKARVQRVPIVDDEIRLHIYRLPIEHIQLGEDEFPLTDVDEDHHYYLTYWMKHLAYLKQDAETLDKSKSADFKALFEGYCAQVKVELDRAKSTPRVVEYGGL